MDEFDVAIVGGGVAGGAAACAFGGDSLRVALLERRKLAQDANRGDALHAAAVERLRGWDVMPALEQRGALWVRRMVFCSPEDRPRVAVELEDRPFLMLSHAEIELALLETARRRGVDVREVAARHAIREDGHWRVDTTAGPMRARLVIAADGARSVVREAVGIPAQGDGYGQATVVMHAARPSWLAEDMGWAVIHRDGGVLILPTTPAGSCRVVAQVEDSALPQWRASSDADLRALLRGRHRRLGELDIRRHVGGSHIYRLSWQHAERYVAPGLALIGDAAHVSHPNGGQGMTMAIEDAATLSGLAARALRSGGPQDLRAALWEYAARRRPASARALARADRVARMQRRSAISYAAGWSALAAASLAPRRLADAFNRFGAE